MFTETIKKMRCALQPMPSHRNSANDDDGLDAFDFLGGWQGSDHRAATSGGIFRLLGRRNLQPDPETRD